MEERKLKVIAIVVMLIALPGLYAAMGYKEPDKDQASCSNRQEDPNRFETLTGRVISSAQHGGITILKVSRTMPVLIKENVSISCGSTVQVNGFYDSYQGEPEFVARSFSIVKEAKNGACKKE